MKIFKILFYVFLFCFCFKSLGAVLDYPFECHSKDLPVQQQLGILDDLVKKVISLLPASDVSVVEGEEDSDALTPWIITDALLFHIHKLKDSNNLGVQIKLLKVLGDLIEAQRKEFLFEALAIAFYKIKSNSMIEQDAAFKLFGVLFKHVDINKYCERVKNLALDLILYAEEEKKRGGLLLLEMLVQRDKYIDIVVKIVGEKVAECPYICDGEVIWVKEEWLKLLKVLVEKNQCLHLAEAVIKANLQHKEIWIREATLYLLEALVLKDFGAGLLSVFEALIDDFSWRIQTIALQVLKSWVIKNPNCLLGFAVQVANKKMKHASASVRLAACQLIKVCQQISV